ncbi:glycoside hydrolase family 97 catalytic domain-containing protein [Zunongwangia sp.]|uniref:glycoside hydrolase family 97 protein n=1 Tax=Zunongwangia sp. TaxID=1965325 RepID=UPI003AA84F76
MKTNTLKLIIFSLFLSFSINSNSQESILLHSPDKLIAVKLFTNATPSYSVKLGNEDFLEKSVLGLKSSIGDFSKGLKFINSNTSQIDTLYSLKKAKTSKVHYVANQLTATFINSKKDTLKILFRVSNTDVAYSYRINAKSNATNIKIYKELSSFNLPDNAKTFITPQAKAMSGWNQTKPSYEEEYTLRGSLNKPSKFGVGYTFPALFEIPEKGWVLLSETGVDSHYPGSRLSEASEKGIFSIEFPQEEENNSLGNTYAAQALPAKTPWRTITLGKDLHPIIESTVAFDLVKQKYKPTIDYKMGRATWSWIVWQDGSINYDDQRTFIDLAENLNFEYVLIDNWWDRNIGKEKIAELVDYAKSKNIGVILWYNSNGFWNNAPQTPQDKMNNTIARQQEMEWLQKIGVKGLKVDFFGGDKQTTMKLYENILTDANKYGLTITFHGCTLPRGWEKMYPNYVTSEAVLASENLIFMQDSSNKHARNATILPFTRNAVGAMDFAPVFFNKVLSKDQKNGSIRKTTDAFEVATAVLYFSPVQHFGITPNNLKEQPKFIIDFIKNVPTTWDKTLYVGGKPLDYVAIARQKGEKWYVPVVNGEQTKKTVMLNLPMLAGKEVKIIYDKKDASAAIKTQKINNNGKLKITMQPEGGAMIFQE